MRYRCPSCHRGDCLYRDVMVPGWQDVDEELKPGRVDDDGDPVETGDYGCSSCEWRGRRSALEVLGWDDVPLIRPGRGQITLDISEIDAEEAE